jgi:carboxyl-terminal processing protease
MSIQQAQLLLSGPPGSTVKIAIVRGGSLIPRNIEVTRAIVPEPGLLTTRYNGDIAYLRVAAFDRGSAKQIRSQLLQFEHHGARKLILDLRGCASGEASEAIQTAQLFLHSGTIATLRGQTIETETYSANPSKQVWRGPVSVLTSGSTAGPAEILAAAIAGNHRGDTIGQNTLGLASQQKLVPLEDGSALLLTVGIYYTPENKAILNNGVSPTIHVPAPNSQLALLDSQDVAPDPTPGQLPKSGDLVVQKAIEILQGGSPAGATTAGAAAPSSGR